MRWDVVSGSVTASSVPSDGEVDGDNAPSPLERAGERHKLSFREKQEFEALGKEIDELEKEKKEIEAALSCGTLSTQDIIDLSKRLPVVNDLLDEKSMRWLELSEIEE